MRERHLCKVGSNGGDRDYRENQNPCKKEQVIEQPVHVRERRETSLIEQSALGNEDREIEEDKQEEGFGCEKLRPLIRARDPELSVADEAFVMDNPRYKNGPADGDEHRDSAGQNASEVHRSTPFRSPAGGVDPGEGGGDEQARQGSPAKNGERPLRRCAGPVSCFRLLNVLLGDALGCGRLTAGLGDGEKDGAKR